MPCGSLAEEQALPALQMRVPAEDEGVDCSADAFAPIA
jgi:hypothetical protein